MRETLIFVSEFFLAFMIFLLARNHVIFLERGAFIDDDALYPAAFEKLPEYQEMALHPKHYHRWTKAHWVKYVDGK